jgi:hypothetical protein
MFNTKISHVLWAANGAKTKLPQPYLDYFEAYHKALGVNTV